MKEKKSSKKILYWIVAVIILYVLTSAKVTPDVTVEVEKKVNQVSTVQEPYLVEKLVKTTKYRTERKPFGTPRCEQMNYNFSKTYSYSEKVEAGKKIGTCTFFVTNDEDIAGTFEFYPQFLKSGKINDGPNMVKKIEAFGTERFEWNLTIETSDTLSCMLQIQNPPKRMKCFYLEPIIYQTTEVPYTVEELKNVTEYRIVEKTTQVVIKQNVTKDIYTNRFLGYDQFFYFGY